MKVMNFKKYQRCHTTAIVIVRTNDGGLDERVNGDEMWRARHDSTELLLTKQHNP
jgi:hypothetical protein